MYVSKLELWDVRSYKRLDLGLSKNINLLVGNNNSGKSTIIKSLYKLQNPRLLGDQDIRKKQPIGKIFIDIEDINGKEFATFSVNNSDGLTSRTDKIKVVFTEKTGLNDNEKIGTALCYDGNDAMSRDESGIIIASCGDELVVPPVAFHNLPTVETKGNFIYPFFSHRKSNYYGRSAGSNDAFLVSETLVNITAKVQKLSNPSHPKNKEFITYIKDILGFDVGAIPHQNNETNTGLFVTDSIVIPIDNMGDGVANILGLIVMLLTEDRKLYLIEELENDIHPQALKKLLNLILQKSANNQFVISTHSNIVVKYLSNSYTKIYEVTWQPFEEDESDKLPTSAIKQIENTPEARLKLLENLGYDIFDFDLHKAYIIFEESSAERIVKDFLIPHFAPTLANKVKTIAASGASDIGARFHDFLRLFVFVHNEPIYSSRAWVFADGDETGIENIEKLKTSFPTWAPEYFVNFSKSNFEEFYPKEFQEEFNSIINIKDKDKKRSEKIKFTNRILEWIDTYKDEAIEKFAISADELIKLLKEIEKKLNKHV